MRGKDSLTPSARSKPHERPLCVDPYKAINRYHIPKLTRPGVELLCHERVWHEGKLMHRTLEPPERGRYFLLLTLQEL